MDFTILLELTLHSILEFVLYSVIDYCCKCKMLNLSSTEEKQRIWRWESLILLVATLAVYLHHFPYILVLMTSLTFTFTQTSWLALVRDAVASLNTKWDEFNAHEESIKQQNNQLQDAVQGPHAEHSAPDDNPAADNIPRMAMAAGNVAGIGGPLPDSSRDPASSGLPQNVPLPAYFSDTPTRSTSQTLRDSTGGSARNAAMSGVGVGSAVPHDTRPNLARPPITASASWIKSMSSMLGNYCSSTNSQQPCPPGLTNALENICFLNCILQTLSRTPTFYEELMLTTPVRNQAFVLELRTLFGELLVEQSSSKTLNAVSFRAVASCLCRLIQNPRSSERQMQQDVCECLTLLFEILHTSLNDGNDCYAVLGQNGLGNATETVSPRYFTRKLLCNLMTKYNRPTPDYARSVRAISIQQIESANGEKSDQYVGYIRTVSDLDWLQHHRTNFSLIEELFSGQIVDCRMCEICRHVAVGTQCFRILSVPIAEPNSHNEIAELVHCIERSLRIETLGGENALVCGFCNRLQTNSPAAAAAAVPTSNQDMAASPLGNHLGPMSPIGVAASGMLNDSGVGQRTSTPIPPSLRPLPLHRTQFVRRSLIGFAPSCLVVQLMRFQIDRFGNPRKILVPVNIPLEGLDLSSLLLSQLVPHSADRSAQQEMAIYNLYAVCLHLGSDSTAGGHYTCYALANNNVWYGFNDTVVRIVNIKYELTTLEVRENAYLLFYRRVR